MMFQRLSIIVITLASCVWPAAHLQAADFHISEHGMMWKPWENNMPLNERLDVLAQEGLYVYLKGPITKGDYETLSKIHALVPVHTLKISSPGGSVAEALKIAEFVDNHLLEVWTDWGCDGEDKKKAYCGCASSCALIWLAAPLRRGDIVRIHRPYFEGAEFQSLPDDIAFKKYSDATKGIRSLLQSRGYSQEFLGALFRIPREQTKQLTPEEISSLPIDVALDELTRARCYSGNEEQLRHLEAINEEIARLEKEKKIISESFPPDMIGMELERDPLYRKDYAKLNSIRHRIDGLRGSAKQLSSVHREFSACKWKERIQASLRKSGRRLTPEIRSKIKEFLTAAAGIESTALIAKHVPDHPIGREAAADLMERQARIKGLWEEFQQTLPVDHRNFLTDALKRR